MATNGKVGVRHILDVEEQDWILREDVARGYKSINGDQESKFPLFWLWFLGLGVLEEEGKVFDCLVRPPTLKHVATIGEDDQNSE